MPYKPLIKLADSAIKLKNVFSLLMLSVLACHFNNMAPQTASVRASDGMESAH